MGISENGSQTLSELFYRLNVACLGPWVNMSFGNLLWQTNFKCILRSYKLLKSGYKIDISGFTFNLLGILKIESYSKSEKFN